ncbi:MAG: transglycosylase SLT domain-containing protein [Bacteroidales bacterium]|nr:transglycosylase SLT domain-containing protein [Bacteroidales bacterium]MBO4566321.1 transglycosylase SLT domain-containing protein [Bacteroidales bacterium]
MKAIRTALALLALACALSCNRGSGPWHDGTPLRGAVSLLGSDPGSELLCGYNYELISRYAGHSGRTAEIRLAAHKEGILDSLRNGTLDIVSFPWLDAMETDSTLVQIEVDSCGIWVFSADRAVEAEKAAEWLHGFRARADYPIIRQPFFDIYNPLTRVSADFISPYDSLLRVYADTLDWDWKLLAAVVYQESKFQIEARSARGAAGLMQLLPDTARHFGCSNVLDPEQNIRAGVMMLLAVRARYLKIAATPDELTKFTLAGYNAGTGRLKDCLNYARHLGVDISRWENIAAVIPDMQHDSIAALDTIKYGRFPGGAETVSYVRKVRRFYDRYTHICE